MTGLFNAYVSLINSERQVLWQRYNILLAANSVILGFIVNRVANPLHQFELAVSCIFGFLLCIAWGVLTWCAWNIFTTWNSEAEKFMWLGVDSVTPINPIQVVKKHEKEKNLIKRCSSSIKTKPLRQYAYKTIFPKKGKPLTKGELSVKV
jgi:hypothetical protein